MKLQNSLILVGLSNVLEKVITPQHRPEESLRYIQNLNSWISRAFQGGTADLEIDMQLFRAIWSIEPNSLDAITAALKTTLAVNRSFQDFNHWAESEGLPCVRFSAGIDAGVVLLGGTQPLGAVINSVHAFADEAIKSDCFLVIPSELVRMKVPNGTTSMQPSFKTKRFSCWDKDVVFLTISDVAALLN